MYINFECLKCGATFRIDEMNLYQVDKLSCPSCKKKVPQRFVEQLQHFIIDSNSESFGVTFSSKSEIRLQAINNAISNNIERTFRDIAPSETNEDLMAILHSAESVRLISAMLSGAIFGYHNELKKSLSLIGIDIGEMK